MPLDRIAAVTVNHNTSEYTELMLRSLFAKHGDLDNLSITVMDNNSTDNTKPLEAYLQSKKIPLIKTKWTPTTPGNSHGENLRDFVISSPNHDYILFLDPDVVFVQDETLKTMLQELKRQDNAWAVQARISYDGINEYEGGSLAKGGQKRYQNIAIADTFEEVQAGQQLEATPLPVTMAGGMEVCCCLIKNTQAFQLTASEIGFSCAHFEESGGGMAYDIMGLATRVMKTHSLDYMLSSKMIMHFGCVSYIPDATKTERCQQLLGKLRL